MKYRRKSLLAVITILVVAVLACTMNLGGPKYPAPSIPVSTEAVGELQSSLKTAVANGAESGQITLTMTESQLTSFLFYKLSAQSQPLFTDPQVYLKNGQIQVYGTAIKSYFKATVLIILTAGVDAQGKLIIELTSANFGPLPVPDGLKEIITASIQEAYTGALGPVATGFKLQNIDISSGIMTIVGQVK